MRFCPACNASNPDDATACVACTRTLPAPPPRRARGDGATASGPVVSAVAGSGPVAVPAVIAPAAPSGRTRATLPPPTPVRSGTTATGVPPIPRRPPTPTRPPPTPAPRAGLVDAPLMPPSPSPSNPALIVPVAAPVPVAASVPVPEPVAAPVPVPALSSAAAEASPATTLPAVASAAIEAPPPTRVIRPEEWTDRPYVPKQVRLMPPTPEAKPVPLARYAIDVTRARWQRRRAIQQLHDDIRQDTAALDHIFAALGRKAREHGLQNRATTAEHQAITTAEQLRVKLLDEDAHVRTRSADEDARFAEVERGQVQRVGEAEQVLEAKQAVLTNVEAQRRALRDKRKEVERRQRGYEKAAETREDSAAQQPMGPERTQLRAAALEMRREAQTLDPERQDLDRKLAALETPVAEAQAEVDAAKAQLSIARDALNNSREGHTHRAAELGAEQKTKQRQLEDTEAEILRRLVTLGTLLNLERIVDPRLDELYGRIDRVRTAIAARGAEIDRLTQERAGHDRGAWMRGWAVIGGAVIGVLVLIALALALT